MWTGKENCLYQHGRLKYDNEETTLLLQNLMSKKKRKKKTWVRKVYQNRKLKGEFHVLITEMMHQDHAKFFAYFRMSLNMNKY